MKKRIIIGITSLVLIGTTVGAIMENHAKSQSSATEPVHKEITITQADVDAQNPTSTETPAPVEAPIATPKATPQVSQAPVAPQPSNPYIADGPIAYVYDRRQSAGKAVGQWGNVGQWVTQARLAGILVDTTPHQFDVAIFGQVFQASIYFVESVNPDGSIVITSHNKYPGTGTVTETVSDLRGYKFIH